MQITLQELQVFTAVVDTASITSAAERLNQTVSGVSRALGRLEHKLQTTLLRRTTRRLELTEEGQAFLKHARDILTSVEEAEEQMASRLKCPSGLLRIDAATPFILHVITPLIESFRTQYPQVELELNSNEGITDLIEKRTDVAFRVGSLRDSTLHARLIGTSRIRILASPEYLEQHGTPVNMEQLAQHTLLGFTKPELLNQWPLHERSGDMLQIKPVISSSSGETLRHLALSGAGIVCLSDFMTQRDRQAGRLVQLFPEQTLEVKQSINAVYYRNTALSSRITSFINHIIEELGERPFDEL
ncbi:LysR substrate-binding domain-containing protein [uncultured Microbulbifer sp.]|uniref:LysR substrate-binding domain-containing protein n=1 Tax=uncultured Microbulbifer sp. TaxID=348147 RepID=UPI00262E5E54|nr:LysR substrate-binding domain-containing protein [uncultured Microbulbifer sp.]